MGKPFLIAAYSSLAVIVGSAVFAHIEYNNLNKANEIRKFNISLTLANWREQMDQKLISQKIRNKF